MTEYIHFRHREVGGPCSGRIIESPRCVGAQHKRCGYIPQREKELRFNDDGDTFPAALEI